MSFLIYCILYPISFLPLPVLYGISDFLFPVIYHLTGYRKKVVTENLVNSFPEKSKKELKKIRKRYFHYLCDLLVEGVKMLSISKKNVMKRYVCTNPEILDPYFKNKQSVILMSAHYNDWEWMVLSLDMQLQYHGVGIGKENTNKHFEGIINKFRTRYGTEVVFARNVRECMKQYFVRGIPCAYMMLSDQTPASAERAFILKNFMHQPTDMIYGSEYFAKKYNFPVFYYVVKRIKRGYYTWTIEDISKNPEKEAYGNIIKKYSEKLQRDIKAKPDYWLWSHRRWKHHKQIMELLDNEVERSNL